MEGRTKPDYVDSFNIYFVNANVLKVQYYKFSNVSNSSIIANKATMQL